MIKYGRGLAVTPGREGQSSILGVSEVTPQGYCPQTFVGCAVLSYGYTNSQSVCYQNYLFGYS
jgi:hypothetical protein